MTSREDINIDLLDRLTSLLESIGNEISLGGLTQDDIDSIPIEMWDLLEPTTCSICLDFFKVGKSKYKRLECGHPFHVRCINKWLKMRGTCPCCRRFI